MTGDNSKTDFEIYHYLDNVPDTISITPTNQAMANCTYWITDKTRKSFNVSIYESGDWSPLDASEDASFNYIAKI